MKYFSLLAALILLSLAANSETLPDFEKKYTLDSKSIVHVRLVEAQEKSFDFEGELDACGIRMLFVWLAWMAGITVVNSSELRMSTYDKITSLSGVEAEILRVAVERFRNEELGVGVSDYKISMSRINDVYIVLFRNPDSAPPEAVYISYDVEVSAETLKVMNSQYSR